MSHYHFTPTAVANNIEGQKEDDAALDEALDAVRKLEQANHPLRGDLRLHACRALNELREAEAKRDMEMKKESNE